MKYKSGNFFLNNVLTALVLPVITDALSDANPTIFLIGISNRSNSVKMQLNIVFESLFSNSNNDKNRSRIFPMRLSNYRTTTTRLLVQLPSVVSSIITENFCSFRILAILLCASFLNWKLHVSMAFVLPQFSNQVLLLLLTLLKPQLLKTANYVPI